MFAVKLKNAYHFFNYFSGALFDQNSLQSHTAFRYEIEKHNNGTQWRFKLDKYEKTFSVADSLALKKSSKYI